MKSYKCPLCGSALTKAKYEATLHIQKERDKSAKADLEKLHNQIHSSEQRESDLKARLKASNQKGKLAESEGVKKGALTEKRRQERLTAGLKNKVQTLQSRIGQLERGTTPQTEGLEFEENLYKRLRKEFAGDVIEHKGKGGDILHSVMQDREDIGTIIYECKQTPKILPDHVQQCCRAKKARRAHFGILITTGTRRGFTGLAHEDGILIVAPLGVVALAHLCRAHLVEMAKARLDKDQRSLIAGKLVQYVTSPSYKIPLEQAIQKSTKLGVLLRKEVKAHLNTWQHRYELYLNIHWDISQIQTNVSRVLQGETVLQLEKPKLHTLSLPAITHS
jgi:hypothetical protein